MRTDLANASLFPVWCSILWHPENRIIQHNLHAGARA
jgi:hypothetical protein